MLVGPGNGDTVQQRQHGLVDVNSRRLKVVE